MGRGSGVKIFSSGDYTMQEVAKQLQGAEDEVRFNNAIYNLKKCLKQLGINSEYLMEVEKRAYYFPNSYSEKDTKEKIEQAKKKVLEYINEMMDTSLEDKRTLSILENFYLFLEGLIEREPHKRAGIQKEQLETLKIKNEYDVQHLLFAYIRPLYPMARTEVSEDTGYNTVRVDIALDAKTVIDKEKIIENPLNFKITYEKKIANKQIYIIIHQPKIL